MVAHRKDPAQRVRRNKPPEVTELVADGGLYGPDLPGGRDWPAETVAWWETWRVSAQAQKFVGTDWSFLLDTAVLHALYWRGGVGLATELRQRVAKFGATWEDRVRLGVAAVGDLESKSAGVRGVSKSDRERRSRLMRAVGE